MDNTKLHSVTKLYGLPALRSATAPPLPHLLFLIKREGFDGTSYLLKTADNKGNMSLIYGIKTLRT